MPTLDFVCTIYIATLCLADTCQSAQVEWHPFNIADTLTALCLIHSDNFSARKSSRGAIAAELSVNKCVTVSLTLRWWWIFTLAPIASLVIQTLRIVSLNQSLQIDRQCMIKEHVVITYVRSVTRGTLQVVTFSRDRTRSVQAERFHVKRTLVNAGKLFSTVQVMIADASSQFQSGRLWRLRTGSKYQWDQRMHLSSCIDRRVVARTLLSSHSLSVPSCWTWIVQSHHQCSIPSTAAQNMSVIVISIKFVVSLTHIDEFDVALNTLTCRSVAHSAETLRVALTWDAFQCLAKNVVLALVDEWQEVVVSSCVRFSSECCCTTSLRIHNTSLNSNEILKLSYRTRWCCTCWSNGIWISSVQQQARKAQWSWRTALVDQQATNDQLDMLYNPLRAIYILWVTTRIICVGIGILGW